MEALFLRGEAVLGCTQFIIQILRWADFRCDLVILLSVPFYYTFAEILEKMEFPHQCSLEFHCAHTLWYLDPQIKPGEVAERTVSDRFQSHFLF